MKQELQKIVKSLANLVDLKLEEKKESLPENFFSWENPKDQYIDLNTISEGDIVQKICYMNYAGLKRPYWYKANWAIYRIRRIDKDLIFYSEFDYSNVLIATKDYFNHCIKLGN